MAAGPVYSFSPLLITGSGRATSSRITQVRESTETNRPSPKFSIGLKEGRGKSEYRIKWDIDGLNIPQAWRDFVGYTESNLDSVGAVYGLNRVIPYPHPSAPNYLYADGIPDIEGDVPDGSPAQDINDVAKYQEAKLGVTFSTRPYVILASGIADESLLQQYVMIKCNTTTVAETLPSATSFYWAGTDVAVANARTVLITEGEVEMTWFQIPVEAIPWSAIAACVGKCDAAVNPLGVSSRFDFALNTYLGPLFPFNLLGPLVAAPNGGRSDAIFICLSPKIGDPYPMVTGEYACDIMYRFKVKPQGANFFYRWETGQFERAIKTKVVPGPNAPNLPADNNGLNKRGFYQPARLQTLFYGA